MIISSIIGGLGNQMFQYATGRALALERELPFRMDVAGFSGYVLHQGFELQRVFEIPAEIATAEEVHRILGWQFSQSLQRLMALSWMEVFRRRGFIVEPHFHYWPGIKNVPCDCFFRGYWQSEKYFHEAVSVIREDFSFKNSFTGKNAELAEHIGSVNAVSLHVRRGDYVKNPATTALHGLCPLEYYQAAIRYLADRVEHPYFFIFSDDIPWVRKHLQMNFPCEYVDHNCGMESYNDMHLMSLCKHYIIANSSFSWWGAWLNPHTDKIVIWPQRWFAKDKNTKDLFPLEWVSL